MAAVPATSAAARLAARREFMWRIVRKTAGLSKRSAFLARSGSDIVGSTGSRGSVSARTRQLAFDARWLADREGRVSNVTFQKQPRAGPKWPAFAVVLRPCPSRLYWERAPFSLSPAPRLHPRLLKTFPAWPRGPGRTFRRPRHSPSRPRRTTEPTQARAAGGGGDSRHADRTIRREHGAIRALVKAGAQGAFLLKDERGDVFRCHAGELVNILLTLCAEAGTVVAGHDGPPGGQGEAMRMLASMS